jgi:hypothetical protein
MFGCRFHPAVKSMADLEAGSAQTWLAMSYPHGIAAFLTPNGCHPE